MKIDADKLEHDVMKSFANNIESNRDPLMTEIVAQVAARMAVIAVTLVLEKPELYQLAQQNESD